MANYIKIFNDTVLKQSILQGYQAQRTNHNLGSFTMGELAFTRDTGRVFVGNFTNQDNEADSQQVQGGILVGNKYLGMVDSKPLGHFSPNNFPLKYGVKNISTQQLSDDGEEDQTIKVQEQGILLKGSIHRKDKNGGWNKNVNYIEKYDAYSGDYMFDIFNNAFILFDKNITTDETLQPTYSETMSPQNQQFFLDENGNKVDGKTVTRRTKIYDNSGERNKNYPIYGDGYVIMRILEPDGVTLGYKDRGFTELGIPKVDKDEKNNVWQNWSHNLLELKHVPSSILMGSMTEDNFYDDGNFIRLNRWQKNIDGFLGTELSIPRSITFANYTPDQKTSDITIKPDGEIVLDDKESRTLKFNINSSTAILPQNAYDKVLSIDDKNVVSIKEPYRQQFNIALQDGLINPLTGGTTLSLTFNGEQENKLALGFTSTLNVDNDEKGSNNPFYTSSTSSYYYSGNNAYNISGNLVYSDRWDNDYKSKIYNELNQFDNQGNVGYNTLKKPMPFCWVDSSTYDNNGTANLQFLIKPFLFCVKKDYIIPKVEQTITDEEGNTTTIIRESSPQEYFATTSINDVSNAITVLGNNGTNHLEEQSDYYVVDGFTTSPEYETPFEGYNGDTKDILYHVPFGDNEKYNTDFPKWDWSSTMTEVVSTTEGKAPTFIFQDGNASSQNSIIYNIFNNNINDTRTGLQGIYPSNVTNYNESINNYPCLLSFMLDSTNGGWYANNLTSSDNNVGQVNFSALIPKGVSIKKIEISTNDENNRLLDIFKVDDTDFTTLIEKSDNNTLITSANYALPLLVNKIEGSDNVYVYALTNGDLFTNKENTPYYIKLHTSDGKITTIPFGNFVELDKISILMYTEKVDSGTPNVFYSLKSESPFDNYGKQSSKLIGIVESTETSFVVKTIENYINSNGKEVDRYSVSIDQTEFQGSNSVTDVTTYNVIEYQVDKTSNSYDTISFVTAKNKHEQLSPMNEYLDSNNNHITIQDAYGYETNGSKHMLKVTYNGKIFTKQPSENDYSLGNKSDFKVQMRLKAEVATIMNGDGSAVDHYKIQNIVPCPIYLEPQYQIIQSGSYSKGDEFTEDKCLAGKNYFLFWGTYGQTYDEFVKKSTGEYPSPIFIQKVPKTIASFNLKTFIKKSVPTYEKGYVIPTDISWENDNKVVIPDNAQSIICDVHYQAISNTTPTTIYYAGSKDLLKSDNEPNTNTISPYQFPFTISGGKVLMNNSSSMGANQKILYSNSQSGSQIIEIPLKRFNLNKSKGFNIRINNAPNMVTNQLVIRIIGYRV